MLRVSRCITGDEGAQVGVGDPVKQARAENAGAEPALAGDDQDATRAEPGLAQNEVDDLAVGRVLRVAVQIDASIDLVLSPADAALTRQVFRRSGASNSGAWRLPCPLCLWGWSRR